MSGAISRLDRPAAAARPAQDPRWVRWTLSLAAVLFLGLFLFVPLGAVFAEALRRGVGP